MASNHTTEPSERAPWDHGTANQAIEFLLHHRQAPGEETEFLKAWEEGALDEWPEYYEWLAKTRALSPSPDDRMGEVALEAIRVFVADYDDGRVWAGCSGALEDDHIARFRTILEGKPSATTRLAASREGDMEAAFDAFMNRIVVDGNGGFEFLEEALTEAFAALASPAPMPEGEITEALCEIMRRTDLLMNQNRARWDMRVEHDRRTYDVLALNQEIARAALGSVQDKGIKA